jgi:hypothetical protein
MKDGSVCPGGYVKLQKVKKSIFNVDKKVQNKINEINRNNEKPKTVVPDPKPDEPKMIAPKPDVPKPIRPKPVVIHDVPKPLNTDSINRVLAIRKKNTEDSLKRIAVVTPKPVDTLVKPTVKTDPLLTNIKGRSNELIQTISVSDTNEHIIKIYDYGEVDGDIVTIYLNNKVIVSNALLNTKPIEIPIKLDIQVPEVTITLVAENMGSIPPNTAFMVVYIAGKRYEAKIESTEQKNASIRFEYTGK